MSYLDHDGPIAFAHRGGARMWPENTLLAFREAASLGIRWMETDVHLSADGHVVVFHDATLDRTTDGTGPVADRTLAELRVLDAGRGEAIPTLAELLTLPDYPDLRVNIDIKAEGPRIISALWDVIAAHHAFDRVLVASVSDAKLAAFRAHRDASGRHVATSAGSREVARFWARAHTLSPRRKLPFEALQVPATYRGLPVVTRRFVRVAHDLGVAVHVWTIDERREMERLLELGVDGLMSDRPDVLVEVLGAK